MGLNLGGIASAFLDPGKVVKEVVDAVLPEKYDVIADLAGAIVDFKTGRPLQGAQHLAQALKDLPQALADDKSVKDPLHDPTRGTPAFEPTPPPSRGNGSEGFDWKKITEVFSKLMSFFSSWKAQGPTSAPSAQQPAASWSAAPSAPPASSSDGWRTSAIGTSSSGWRPASTGGAVPGDWRGAPPSVAPPPSSPSSTTKKPSSTQKKSTASTSTTSTKKKATSAAAKKDPADSSKKAEEKKPATGTAAAKLSKMSDDELMKMVRNGTIPDDILDDKKAMLALQNRIQHITEMTKLMTQLMQAFHEIQMSVLHNVRA
jgi:hypothetical protein